MGGALDATDPANVHATLVALGELVSRAKSSASGSSRRKPAKSKPRSATPRAKASRAPARPAPAGRKRARRKAKDPHERAAHLVGSARDAGQHARPHESPRRDDCGRDWTRGEVEREVRDIVGTLAQLPAGTVTLATRFSEDLDWDSWFVLAVVKPIARRLHEELTDFVILQLETVGDLVNYVWARMEIAA